MSRNIKKTTVQEFTSSILDIIFDESELASCSVTGTMSNAFKENLPRPGLDKNRLAAARSNNNNNNNESNNSYHFRTQTHIKFFFLDLRYTISIEKIATGTRFLIIPQEISATT